jgi:hypothetical protein
MAPAPGSLSQQARIPEAMANPPRTNELDDDE